MIEIKRALGESFFALARVLNRGRMAQHAPAAQVKKKLLSQTLLPQAPGIEVAQRAKQIRNPLPLAGSRGGDASMRKDPVNVDQIKIRDILAQPSRHGSRILECLAQLLAEKNRGHSVV